MDLWTQFLNILSQVITPSWNDLLQYMPLLFVGLILLSIVALTRSWQRNAPLNRPRVVVPATSGALPPGVHLPGPSPWPFVAPIGLMFVFMGFVFGPWLILGGLIMSGIAVLGWYRDAGYEYRQIEEGHPPEPRTRDPEQAFPKRLVPIYAGVAAFTLFVTMLPFLLSLLPGSAAAKPQPSGGGGAPTTTPVISASSAASFDQSEVVVAAGKPLTLTFDNKNAGVPHNVAIFDGPDEAKNLFTGDIVTGPAKVVYDVPPLPAASYYFVCSVHANMHGTIIAK